MLLTAALIICVLPVHAAGQDAWGKASPYMTGELREAQSIGLIPDIIIGADFTKPITRIEFAHLIILMCETYTGVSTEPHMLAGNPFTDTGDHAVFKAYCFGIMNETNEAGTLFSPDEPIDRETMAYIVYRAIRLMAPLADFTVSDLPDIPDIELISESAKPAVQYLYSRGIINGGKNHIFMPRPVSNSQKTSGYGIATREQCVAVAYRVFKSLPAIQKTRFSVRDKAAEIMSYAADEPQDGKIISREELTAFLQPCANKIRVASNVIAVSFLGDFTKTGDEGWIQGYDSAFLYSAVTVGETNQYKYNEEQTLWGNNSGKSRFALNIFDVEKKLLTSYEWDSVSGTGVKAETTMQSVQIGVTFLSLANYIPGRADSANVYKIYGDTVINGERCVLFSETRSENMIEGDKAASSRSGPPELLRDITDYFYISTVSGLCVLQSNYETVGDTTYQTIRFVFGISPSLADVSKTEPPANITFTTQ